MTTSKGSQDRNWKGNAPLILDVEKHRWQSEQKNSDSVKSSSRRETGWLPFLGALVGLGLTGSLVYLLTYAPVKTPVLAVCAGQYVWPIRLPAHRLEDFVELEKLDGKTIRLINTSREWSNRSGALADLERRAAGLAQQAARSGSCVIYLAMQGVVNDSGTPCFIPTQGDPLDPNSWISIDDLVNGLRSGIPAHIHCLFVIDPIDLGPNWHAGILSQTFTFRLTEWLEQRADPKISILVAAKDDQEIIASGDLKGTLFGRELRIGLSGAADRYASNSRMDTNQKPNDGVISAGELARFVSTRVQDWSKKFRHKEQTPILIRSKNQDPPILWASLVDETTKQLNELVSASLPTPSIPSEELAAMWDLYHQLKAAKLYLDAPGRWTEMENGLLRLEEANRSGAVFSDTLKRQLSAQTKKSLESFVERSNGPRSRSILERETFLTPTDTPPTRLGPWPSLALKTRFGEIDAPSQTKLGNDLSNLLATPGLVDMELVSSTAEILPTGAYWNEINFINLLKRFGNTSQPETLSRMDRILQYHVNLERLWLDSDPRLFRLHHPMWDKLDESRRKLEDAALSGQTEWPDALLDELQQKLYDLQSNKLSMESLADQALRVRDLFLISSPHILAWLNATHSLDDSADSTIRSAANVTAPDSAPLPKTSIGLSNRKRAAIDRFLQLLDASEEFTKLLSNADPGDPTQRQRILDSADLILQDWMFLQTQWILDAEAMLKHEDLAAMLLPEIGNELQVLVDQKELRDKLRELELVVHNSNHQANQRYIDEALKQNRLGGSMSEPANDGLVLLQSPGGPTPNSHWDSWGEHPFLTYLNSSYRLHHSPTEEAEKAPTNELDDFAIRIERGNRQLRSMFNAFPAFTPNRILTWCKGAGIQLDLPDVNAGWQNAVYADLVERMLSPWSSRRTDAHGYTLVRDIAIKESLGWYARRSLTDFYALKTIEKESTPFFALAVQQVLENMSRLPGSSAELDETVEQIRRELDVSIGSFRHALVMEIKAEDSDSDSNSNWSLTLQANRISVPGGAEWSAELPPGSAGVFRRNPAGDLVALNQAVGLPRANESIQTSVAKLPTDNVASLQEMVVAFRGHEFTKTFQLNRFNIVEYDWLPERRSEVVLFGDKPKQPSIVFVLDCSSSMGDSIPLEAIDSRSQSKLDAAKVGILQLLDQLAAFPDARAGVRLFGHRIGWSRPNSNSTSGISSPTRLLLQPNYQGKIPDGLTPSRDIEAVLPLGRFQPQMVSELSDRLSTVIPWGQSPVYQSIIEAYSDFDADSESTAKCVVLITDGDNFQFNSVRTPGGDRETDTTLDDVLRTAEQSQIPTFVLGVGIDRDSESQAWRNLNQIASASGGKYYDIANRSALLRALTEQLARGEFRLSETNSSTSRLLSMVGEDQISKLNTPVQIELRSRVPQTFELVFQSVKKEFELQGGEALEMTLKDNGLDIKAEPYLTGSPKSAPLRKPNSSDRKIARVHKPVQSNNSVLFPISVQNPNSHYTKRPSELWIEIQPQTDSKQPVGSPYTYYDLPWKSGVTVPLVECLANNWPSDATKASVQVWLSDTPAAGLLSFSLADLRKNISKYESGVTVASLPGYELHAEWQSSNNANLVGTLVVRERWGPESKELTQTKIRLVPCDAPIPIKVRRRVDPTSFAAVHTFQFVGNPTDLLGSIGDAKIELQTKGTIATQAWSLEDGQPIEIDLREANEFLPSPIILPSR